MPVCGVCGFGSEHAGEPATESDALATEPGEAAGMPVAGDEAANEAGDEAAADPAEVTPEAPDLASDPYADPYAGLYGDPYGEAPGAEAAASAEWTDVTEESVDKKGMGAGGWVAVTLGVLVILAVGAAAALYFTTDVFDGLLGDDTPPGGDGTSTLTGTADPGARVRLQTALDGLSDALDSSDGGLATAQATFAGDRGGYSSFQVRRTWGLDNVTRVTVDGGTDALRFTVYCTEDRLVFQQGDNVLVRSLGPLDDCLTVLRGDARAGTTDAFLRAGIDLLTVGPQDLQFIRGSGAVAQTTGEYAHVDGRGYTVTVQNGDVTSIVVSEDDDTATATYTWGPPSAITVPEADADLPAVVVVVRDGGSSTQPEFRLETPHEDLPRDRFQVRVYAPGTDPAGGGSPYRTFGLASGSQQNAGCGYTWLSPADPILDDGDRFRLTTTSECDPAIAQYVVVVWDVDVGAPTQSEAIPAPGIWWLLGLVVVAAVRRPKQP